MDMNQKDTLADIENANSLGLKSFHSILEKAGIYEHAGKAIRGRRTSK